MPSGPDSPPRLRYLGALTLALAALLGAGLMAGGQARAATAAAATVPIVPSAGGATLTQVSGDTWAATVDLDTAALCGVTNSFDLVTTVDIPATTVSYDGAPAPDCAAVGGQSPEGPPHAITVVTLVFTSSALSAVPQSATLAVTPPAAALAAGDPPVDIALTVHREVSAAEYVWKPVGCGLALALLLAGIAGIAGTRDGSGARSRAWRASFWRAPLYAPSAWTFSGSWATNSSALGALAGTVLTASGTVAGLVPGVDLGRLGLLFAIAGIFAVIAPQVFTALNTRFSTAAPPQVPAAFAASGDVAATEMWIMLTASCLTAFGIGAETGLVGWVLCSDLAAGPAWARACVATVTFAIALLFLADALLSIVAMTRVSVVAMTTAPGEPPKQQVRAARASFLL